MSERRSAAALLVEWRPKTDEWVDIAGSVLLTVLGLIGFRTSFGGVGYLVVGFAGVLVGAGGGLLLSRARLPLLVGTAAGVTGFFVTGALVLRPHAIGGLLPTPSSLVALLNGAVTGWANLLTAAPPVGSSHDLLVIPFLCGYAGALLSTLLALCVRKIHLCVLPAMGVLALSVLCGVHKPASLLLQGGVFGAVAIGWMSYRETHKRPALIDTGRIRRQASAAALLGVTALGAFVLGPHLPLADSRPRFVLRDRTEPPFDPSQYPSPLIGLRRYLDDKKLGFKDKVLFTVTSGQRDGLPQGARIRLAVMDGYDGVVWGVTGGSSPIGGKFERVGDEITPIGPNRPGKAVDLSFGIRDLQPAVATKPGVWMPVAGTVSSVQFTSTRRLELADSFRFDRTTDVAAVPVKLQSGDTYRVRTRLVADPSPSELSGRRPARFDAPPTPDLSDEVRMAAIKHTEGAADAVGKARNLEEWLRNGLYSDGGTGSVVAPGHSIRRLGDFLIVERPVGNAEQFAAAMAVMARSLSLPARVVMGFVAPTAGPGPVEIHGGDVDAWVEIAFDGLGWVSFYPTPDHSHLATPETQTTVAPKKEVGPAETTIPPPPATIKRPDPQIDPPEDPPVKKRVLKKSGGIGGIPGAVVEGAVVAGLPLVVALGLAGVVVGLKARRRRRRRTQGGPAEQIAGAWEELIDYARDRGGPVPIKATRREIAEFLVVPRGIEIAQEADAALFGIDDPTRDTAEAIWRDVETSLQEVNGPLPRSHKARVALNLTSLRSRT